MAGCGDPAMGAGSRRGGGPGRQHRFSQSRLDRRFVLIKRDTEFEQTEPKHQLEGVSFPASRLAPGLETAGGGGKEYSGNKRDEFEYRRKLLAKHRAPLHVWSKILNAVKGCVLASDIPAVFS